MKYCVFCVTAGLAAVSYGWGLGDALKVVDKATATVNDANNAVKAVTQQPQKATADAAAETKATTTTLSAPATQAVAGDQPAAAATTSAAVLKWDAAGYTAKLSKVNAAMPDVMKKMPLRGEQEQWYNAAYELTAIDKQFSFLPPAQRVARINPNVQGGVDKFLAWVEGGMQTVATATQPPTGAPVAPSGYDQQPSYANAQATRTPMTAQDGTQQSSTLTAAEEAAFRKECAEIIDEALTHKEYKLERKELENVAFADVDQEKRIQGHVGRAKASMCKNGLITHINRAKSQAEEDTKKASAANAERQSKESELKELVSKFDAEIVKYTNDVAVSKKIIADLAAKYPKFVSADEVSKYGYEIEGFSRNPLVDKFMKKKSDGKYDREMDIPTLNAAIFDLKNDFENAFGGSVHAKGKFDGKCAGPSDFEDELTAIASVELRSKVGGVIFSITSTVASSLKNQINGEIDRLMERKEITSEFREKLWKDRDAAGQSIEKLTAVLKEMSDIVENNEKLAEERASLIKKLAASDVSTWLAEIEKHPKGEVRDAIFADALTAKYGAFAKYGKDSDAVADIVAKLYTVEQQQELLDSNKASISVVIAIVSSVKDAALRKKLLLDSTDWAFHTYRKSSEENENQYAYLVLLSKEKDVDVLMDVYEKQNENVNFSYEKAAKPSEPKTAGEQLEKMWKEDRDNKGHGYGRLGIWMLDHCGKEFGERVRKLAEARRAAAKDQTFLMKDFYLGMPKRDYQLVAKNWDEKKGCVFTQFGAYNNRTLSEIRFGGKARFEYLGIKKDGLSGLEAFVEKYIPGGMESVGEIQVGAAVEDSCDPENPDFKVKSWWYTNCPKYDCRIRMYDSGTICVLFTGDDDYPTLDFSKVK